MRLVSKMAERMSLSVGVEGGWVEMMPRDARRARKRYDARFRIWRRQISGWAGLGKGKGNGCITLSAFHLAPCRPLIMDAKPNSCPPNVSVGVLLQDACPRAWIGDGYILLNTFMRNRVEQ